MSKKFTLLKGAKYIIIALFLALSILSVILIGTVKINYNISDYLDESTDTKISLGIMEDEFSLISNVKVMVTGVSADEANEIKDKLKSIENVKFVNFDSESKDYYKDNTALFVILVEGNEYSDSAKAALDSIMKTMEADYGDRATFSGTVLEKKMLREAIVNEIFLILVISICLVAVLMLITAGSWIEPLVLLAASGVAVLLNLGSNAIFGEISYITNSIAAILQLALSVDYSIVLLHSYNSMKKNNPELDNEHAMLKAIKEVVKPVSASALTTMAGLLALLFMSFTIGFDIGTVLMKSIVISAITALTLLPAFLLIFDKLMQKTAKKPLVLKGRFFANIATKAGKFIVPVAIILIAVCCVVNMSNQFKFVDESKDGEAFAEKFGESQTIIILYENTEEAKKNEEELIRFLESYRTSGGKGVLKSYVAYSNTIGQVFDVTKASRDLGIDEKDAELLFTLYEFSKNSSEVNMNTREFVEFATKLIATDPDAQGFVNEKTAEVLDLLLTLDALLDGEYTSEQFYEELDNLKELTQGKDMSQFAIDQMYGLYFYDTVDTKHVHFKTMLEYIIDSEKLDAELSENLKDLLDGINDFVKYAPDEEVSFNDIDTLFKEVSTKRGLNINQSALLFIWKMELKLDVAKGRTTYLNFMETLLKCADKYSVINFAIPVEFVNIVNNYRLIYPIVEKQNWCTYEDFIPDLVNLVKYVTGTTPEIDVPASSIQQLYIMYFYDNRLINTGSIGGREFIEYIISTAETNETVASQIPENLLPMLQEVLELDDFIDNTESLDYQGMYENINKFASSIESVPVSLSLTETATMGLFVKYSIANDILELNEISATDLLAFVLDASENNELLKGRIDDEMRETIRESQDNMLVAAGLLIGENYSRMLLTIDLVVESEASSQFIEDLSAKAKEIFGGKAYVAGEMATTNDLIKAFDSDNRFISIFTVVSIFVIVMVVFKSLSLPVILVAIIQGAVWIAMSMNFGGDNMFFMSYIMSMCILMGATIDYGILLSTSYVRSRETLDRKEALESAINTALPTVFTSGIILMICGLVVGFVASRTSISSVGFILCKGTLVSTLMIIFVLPAILYLLDKIVIKLTITRSFGEIFKIKGKK